MPRLRRRPLAALLAAVLLLAAAGSAGAYLWGRWHYRAALEALREEDVDQARHHVRACLRYWRRSASARILAGRIERIASDYEKAERELERCKQLHGLSEPLLLEWLLLRAQRGEIDEVAPRLLRRADEGHPEAVEILTTLSRRYIAELRFKLAESCLDRWLALEPDSPRALDWRGWVYEKQLRQRSAAADYLRCLEIDPGRDAVRLSLVDLYLDQNETPAALEHIEIVLARQPDNPRALIAKARCLRLQSESDAAAAVLDGLLEQKPDETAALLQRGMVELDRSRPADAEPWFRRALRLRPDDLEAQFSLYRALAAQPGRAAEAEQVFKRHEQTRKDLHRLSVLLNQPSATLVSKPNLAWEVGSGLIRAGNDQAGLHWLMVALRVDPHHKPTHKTLADFYAEKKNFEKAAEHRRLAEGGTDPAP